MFRKTFNHRSVILPATMIAVGILQSCTDDNLPAADPDKPEGPGTSELVSVELDREVEESGMYFGDFWKEGYANYYFELTDGEVGGLESGHTAPMNEGDYIMCFDLWGGISTDHADPIVPEGLYTANDGRKDGCFDITNTLAVYNAGNEGDKSRLRYIKFTDGTIEVTHVDKGYSVIANLTTSEGNEYAFTYTGPLTLTDWSDDEEDKWEIGKDVTLNPVYITKTLLEDDACDRWYLRCFDTENLSSDGLHVNETGTKFELVIRVVKGGDFAGTYSPGSTVGTFEPGTRIGIFATGTHCERVNPNMTVSYCVMDKGQVEISRNQDGTYSFNVNLITKDGFAVTGEWTCPVEEFVQPPQTTLTEDVVVNPLECTKLWYYGDFYGNGTSDYVVVLATENELVTFDLFSAKADGDDKEFPTGKFTISETNEAGTMQPGKVDDGLTPSGYVKYNPATGDAMAVAPFVSGELTVTKSGEEYTFIYKVYDDFNRRDPKLEPNCISGTWTGRLPEFSLPESAATHTKMVSVSKNKLFDN